jgi:hypothetical protein
MRTNDTTLPTELQRIAHVPEIGVDGEGRPHHFAAGEQTVYVVIDGSAVESHDVSHITTEQWVEHVAEVCGWNERPRLDNPSLGAWLAEELEAVR